MPGTTCALSVRRHLDWRIHTCSLRLVREAFGESFDVPVGYLNTAGMGVPPSCVVTAVNEAVAAWSRGKARAADYEPAVASARQAFANLVGVPVSTVAIGGSVSALVALIASAVADGSRVLVAQHEFTSVTFPFAHKRRVALLLTRHPSRSCRPLRIATTGSL